MRDETWATVDAAIDALPDDAPGGIEMSLLSLVESIRAVVQQRDAALAELEAARAGMEVLRGLESGERDWNDAADALARYDAAKAGKAVE